MAAAPVVAPTPPEAGEPLAVASPMEPATVEAVEPTAAEPAELEVVEPAAVEPAVESSEEVTVPAETPEPVESSAAVEPPEARIADEAAPDEDRDAHEVRRFLRPGDDDVPDGG